MSHCLAGLRGRRVKTLSAAIIFGVASAAALIAGRQPVAAEQSAAAPPAQPATAPPANLPPAAAAPKTQAELEAALAKTLSGATLEGSFTMTGAGRDGLRLSADKYTLGEVKKLDGDNWQIETRIQYGGNNLLVPLKLPIKWAGDTPVIVVDDLTIPGMGTFSARVMFFADHYSGYWKHGERGGSMFGVIRPAGAVEERPAVDR